MIHSYCKSLMSFLRDRTIRHSSCLKSHHDRLLTLNLIKRNSLLREVEIHKASEVACLLSIYHIGILFELLVVALSSRKLQHMYSLWIISVILALCTELVSAHSSKLKINRKSKWIKCLAMLSVNCLLDITKRYTANTADRTSKVILDNFRRNTDCFKHFAALIRLDG